MMTSRKVFGKVCRGGIHRLCPTNMGMQCWCTLLRHQHKKACIKSRQRSLPGSLKVRARFRWHVLRRQACPARVRQVDGARRACLGLDVVELYEKGIW
jgi:hypothetical protein